MVAMKHLLLTALIAQLSLAAALVLPFDSWPHQRIRLPDVNIHFRYAGSGPPLLLVHGFPQYSLTYHTIGPILAQNYTVIIPDLRGAAQSTIPRNNDYTSATVALDLKAILNFLNITSVYIFAHDKGCGPSAALSTLFPSLVKRIGFSEYVLPGFGYESAWTPSPSWDLYQNWQLAFFSIPDAAQFFVQGREGEMLSWYFFHSSYSGNEAVSLEHKERYTREISKPGFLRSGFEYFATETVGKDSEFFRERFGGTGEGKLRMEVLVLGGEASLGDLELTKGWWGPIAAEGIEYDVIPEAGHWIGDENPEWTAARIFKFLAADEGIPSVDLSGLKDRVTLV